MTQQKLWIPSQLKCLSVPKRMVPKYLSQQKCGSKNNVVQKNWWVTQYLVQKNVGSKGILSLNNFRSNVEVTNRFPVKKNLVPNVFSYKWHLSRKRTWFIVNIFWCHYEKNYCEKILENLRKKWIFFDFEHLTFFWT